MIWAMSSCSEKLNMSETVHQAVLLSESVTALMPERGGCYVDATLGFGGHSEAILEKLSAKDTLIAFDADPQAIEASAERLSAYTNVHFVNANFSRLRVELFRHGCQKIDGILFDLGVSSPMLDRPDKGFSYLQNSPLDMRMDPKLSLTAAQILAEYEEAELSRLFFQYGEEQKSRAIARAIVRRRKEKAIEMSRDLAEIIRPYAKPQLLNKSLSRIFQALRIAVNDELNVLKLALEQALEICRPGGRIVVISYHSLEDRIVKQFFTESCQECICPPESPVCICQHQAAAKWIFKKPITASESEKEQNSRSRSAKLRVIEKL
jgi:16S rRNA (cytosine1402-N4)-methyltransferase